MKQCVCSICDKSFSNKLPDGWVMVSENVYICPVCLAKNIKIQTQEILYNNFKDALLFLENHPALNNEMINAVQDIEWSVVPVCKNGVTKNYHGQNPEYITVIFSEIDDNKQYKKYYSDNVHFTDSNEENMIEVPYKTVYGYEWAFKKMQYSGHCSIFKYNESYHYWERMQGEDTCKHDTFEDMIIGLAEKVKKAFGNFNREDFLTPAEKINHDTNEPFNISPDMIVSPGGSEIKGYKMTPNVDYIDVNEKEYNRRWWDWFRQTEYCRQNWKSECS